MTTTKELSLQEVENLQGGEGGCEASAGMITGFGLGVLNYAGLHHKGQY